MIFRRRSLVSLLVCAGALSTRAAQADPSPTDISAAKHAFESAVSLESEQHFREAELKLREALAIKDTPGLRFHLAHCEIEQGRLVEASLEYQRANQLLNHGAKAPDVQTLLGPASVALNKRIPRVTVVFPPDLDGPVASLDGKVYTPSELELGIPVDPWRHTLRVAGNGRRAFERALLLAEGAQLTIRPELPVASPPLRASGTLGEEAKASPAASVAPAAGAQTAAQTGRTSSTKLYLIVGESVLTVAGLAVGLLSSRAAAAATDRIALAQAHIDAAAPGNTSACAGQMPELLGACADVRRAIDDHDRAALLSNIGFVAAGVGVAALATTWFLYPNHASRASRLTVRPLVGFSEIAIEGRF